MRTLSKVMAGVVTLAMSGGLVIGAAGIANAAYNPPAVPYPVDPNNVANITIYSSATGAIVTSGTNALTLDNYYFVASSAFSGVKSKGTISGFLAEAGKAPGAFSGTGLSAASTFPAATAPAPINTFTTPVVKGANSSSFASLSGTYPNLAPSTSDFYQLYQIRLNTTYPTPASPTYAFADLKIDTTAGTWTQVSLSTPPVPPVVTSSSPVATAVAGDASATVTVPVVSGATSYTVTTSTGQTVTGTGPTFAFTGLTNGTPVTFTYTATNVNGISAASAVSAAVTPIPAPLVTTTQVSLTSGAAPFDTANAVTVTASVTASSVVNAGTVTFTDNMDGVLGSSPVTAGVASISKKFSNTGSTLHVVTASYVDGATFSSSSGSSIGFSIALIQVGACADPLSQCSEFQFFQATVSNGSLVISTPYTSTSPFNLGTLALDDTGTLLSATKPFGSSIIPVGPTSPVTLGLQPRATDPVSVYAPNYAGVTIVDRRPGQLGWTANLNAADFVDPLIPAHKIDGHNLGFTGVTPAYIPGNALQAISTFDNVAAAGIAPGTTSTAGVKGTTKFASAPVGASVGTVYVYGNMTLNAPTSTPAGVYASTVTFTVV